MPTASAPADGQLQPATAEMTRVLAVEAIDTQAQLGRTAVTVQRWRHGALHDSTRPMHDHVVMTYLGVPRPICRTNGRHHVAGWTRRSSLTIIPAESDARWDIDGELDALHVYLKPAALDRLADEHSLASNDLMERMAEPDERGAQILRMLLPKEQGAVPDTLFAGQAADLLALYLIMAHTTRGRAPASFRGGLAPVALRRVKEFLDGNLTADVELTQLADLVGLSVFHFCRAFKQSTGIAPYKWRLLRRLTRATELLQFTDLPIIEVAAQVGYDDPSQLARLFKKELDCTPRSFRQHGRNSLC